MAETSNSTDVFPDNQRGSCDVLLRKSVLDGDQESGIGNSTVVVLPNSIEKSINALGDINDEDTCGS